MWTEVPLTECTPQDIKQPESILLKGLLEVASFFVKGFVFVILYPSKQRLQSNTFFW